MGRVRALFALDGNYKLDDACPETIMGLNLEPLRHHVFGGSPCHSELAATRQPLRSQMGDYSLRATGHDRRLKLAEHR